MNAKRKAKRKAWEMLHSSMKDDPLLCAVMTQLAGICWAISLVRQFEFLLKKLNKMDLNHHLSIQDFVNRIPKGPDGLLYDDGGSKETETCIEYLQDFGTLLESECALSKSNSVGDTISSLDVRPRYHLESFMCVNLEDLQIERGLPAVERFGPCFDEFHESIQEILGKGLIVTIRIPSYASYWDIYGQSNGKHVYSPTSYEQANPVPKDGHCLLAVGWGRDSNFGNRLFYQCQESQGPEFADGGYTYIYAELVTGYVDMEVGENPLH